MGQRMLLGMLSLCTETAGRGTNGYIDLLFPRRRLLKPKEVALKITWRTHTHTHWGRFHGAPKMAVS